MMEDVEHDADITRIVAGRRVEYVRTHYTSWAQGHAGAALGVMMAGAQNLVKMQDTVQFLRPAKGRNYRSSRGWATCLFVNAAFRIFNGPIPWSVLQSCAEFAPYVGGRLCCIDRKCSTRDELEIYAALCHLFSAIMLASSRDAAPVGVGNPDGGVNRGVPKVDARGFQWRTRNYPNDPQLDKENIEGDTRLRFG